ncbi:MAG: SulP family inorganic anion transporter [Ferrovum sp.]|nr:SulP family inorganic anion transporter [Ferrovum sp.]NDU87791.1 SulP family inorganic anion transporter [Ferrovum sp.]
MGKIKSWLLLTRIHLFSGILPFSRGTVWRDSVAGVILASMNIPQVLGYARIAGMPAVTGLYSVFLPVVVFAIFGASRHLVVAADSATATILATRLSSLAPASSAAYIALAGMVAIVTAGFLFLARIFKFGFLADFLSRTVLVGFLAGVGVQVAVAMTGDMTGMAFGSSRTVYQFLHLISHLPQIHIPTLSISLMVVTGILCAKHFWPRFPMPFFLVVGGVAASYFLHFSSHGIAVLGPVLGGLPSFGWPQVGWQEALDLVPVAASCVVMILAQSAATSRAYAQRYHETFDENSDILGLAVANAAAGLTGAFVVNGSPTQTAMADMAGARSQVSQLIFAAVVMGVLLFLSSALQYLPHCVLSSLVFTIALGLINVKSLDTIRRESPGEFILALVTAAMVVLIGVEDGILLAIVLSLLRHVRHSYQPHTMVMTKNETGQWQSIEAKPGVETAPGLVVYRFDADLFYANDHFFVDEVRLLLNQAPHPVRWLVIEAGAITDMDYSAARSVSELCEDLANSGINVLFARVNAFLRSDLDRHGITAVIGAEHIFSTLHQALSVIDSASSPPQHPVV